MKFALLKRIVLVLLIGVGLMIPMTMIMGLIWERQKAQRGVCNRSASGVIVSGGQIVKVGTRGLVSEEFFPPARRQLHNFACGVISNALQVIDEVVIRVNLVQSTCHQQTSHDPHMLGAEFSPCEQPVFTTHGNNP